MYAVFFRSTGLVNAIKLVRQKTVAANWYATKCLPEILQKFQFFKPFLKVRMSKIKNHGWIINLSLQQPENT